MNRCRHDKGFIKVVGDRIIDKCHEIYSDELSISELKKVVEILKVFTK
jgi:hypothetical protein